MRALAKFLLASLPKRGQMRGKLQAKVFAFRLSVAHLQVTLGRRRQLSNTRQLRR